MITQVQVSNNSISFAGLLTVAFVVLKLIGAISWSWWWVTAPVWLPLALVAGFFLLAFLIIGAFSIIRELAAERRRKKRMKSAG